MITSGFTRCVISASWASLFAKLWQFRTTILEGVLEFKVALFFWILGFISIFGDDVAIDEPGLSRDSVELI